MTVSPVTSRSLPIALAFVAGFVDTCGFVALAGLFSAHVTGNFVLLGASLVLPHAGELAKLLALPVFVVAVAATRVCLIHWGESRGAVRGVLAAELVFLGVFLVLGVFAKTCQMGRYPVDNFDFGHLIRGDILVSSLSEGSRCGHFNLRMWVDAISRSFCPISCCDDGLLSLLATGIASARRFDRDIGLARRCS
jgi:hypothetical protein